MKDHEGTFHQQTIWHTQQPVCWKATGVFKLAGLATMNFTLIPGAVSSQMVWIPKSMTVFFSEYPHPLWISHPFTI